MSPPIVLPPRHAVLITRTWWAIFLLLAVDAIWIAGAGIGIPHRTFFLIFCGSVFLAAISIFYRTVRRDDAIWLGAQVVNQLVLGSCALGTFNYLGLRLDYPLRDAQFVAVDTGLGFDWFSYIGWVESHPLVARVFTLSYNTTGPEVLIILALLAFFRQFAPLHRYALGYLMSGFMTIFIANFWPATTAYIYHAIPAARYPHLQIAEASAYGQEFFAMRNHAMQALPETFQGLVAFPSFHSALGVLAIRAALSIPSRMLGAAVIIVNVLMLLSTPVDGGHYLVDTLAGAFMGLLVIAASVKLLPEDKGQAGAG